MYFTVPIVAGYYIMQWAEDRAKENLGMLEGEERVLGTMQIDPKSRPEQTQQIELQNDRLNAFLGTLKAPGGGGQQGKGGSG